MSLSLSLCSFSVSLSLSVSPCLSLSQALCFSHKHTTQFSYKTLQPHSLSPKEGLRCPRAWVFLPRGPALFLQLSNYKLCRWTRVLRDQPSTLARPRDSRPLNKRARSAP